MAIAGFPSEVIEKRRYSRLGCYVPMRYRRLHTYLHGFKGCLMKDISEGGARMLTYEFLPLDLKLVTEMNLPWGLQFVQGVSRVAWANKAPFGEQYNVGLEFVNFSQKDKNKIARFIVYKSAER